MSKKKTLSVKMDEELLEKVRYLSSKEYRSMSMYVMRLIEAHIMEYEKQYGKVEV